MGEIIIKDANKIFGMDLMANNRKRENVDGRTAVCYYLRNVRGMKFTYIASLFGKTTSSIIHLITLHEDLYKYNSEYRGKYNQLMVSYSISKMFCNTCVYPFNLN